MERPKVEAAAETSQEPRAQQAQARDLAAVMAIAEKMTRRGLARQRALMNVAAPSSAQTREAGSISTDRESSQAGTGLSHVAAAATMSAAMPGLKTETGPAGPRGIRGLAGTAGMAQTARTEALLTMPGSRSSIMYGAAAAAGATL